MLVRMRQNIPAIIQKQSEVMLDVLLFLNTFMGTNVNDYMGTNVHDFVIDFTARFNDRIYSLTNIYCNYDSQ